MRGCDECGTGYKPSETTLGSCEEGTGDGEDDDSSSSLLLNSIFALAILHLF